MAKTGGFVPTRHVNGANCFQTERHKKLVDNGDRSLIYVGDAVSVTANGQIKRFTQLSASIGVLGIAARVLTNEAGRSRVHGLPDQHPNISLTAQADYIDVYTDPGIVYDCYVDGSAGRSMIGQTMSVAGITTTARVTGAGRSSMILDPTTVVTAVGPFKIVGVSDFTLATRDGDTTGRVQAIVNYAVFKSLDTF